MILPSIQEIRDLYGVLTIDEDSVVYYPYAHCDCKNNLRLVPNGNSAKIP